MPFYDVIIVHFWRAHTFFIMSSVTIPANFKCHVFGVLPLFDIDSIFAFYGNDTEWFRRKIPYLAPSFYGNDTKCVYYRILCQLLNGK